MPRKRVVAKRVKKSLVLNTHKKSDSSPEGAYSLVLGHFNGEITNINCFKAALFFRKLVESYKRVIVKSNKKFQEAYEAQAAIMLRRGREMQPFNPMYGVINKLLAEFFPEEAEVDAGEVIFDIDYIDTKRMFEVYEEYNVNNDLGVKGLGCIHTKAKIHPLTPYPHLHKGRDRRRFQITKELIALSSSLSEILIFSILYSSQPEYYDGWSQVILRAVLDDFSEKGRIKGRISSPTISRAFHKYYKFMEDKKDKPEKDLVIEQAKRYAAEEVLTYEEFILESNHEADRLVAAIEAGLMS